MSVFPYPKYGEVNIMFPQLHSVWKYYFYDKGNTFAQIFFV